MIRLAGVAEVEFINLEENSPIRHNQTWGPEYMLMDSNSFMGGVDGSGYEKVIDMLVSIRINKCNK